MLELKDICICAPGGERKISGLSFRIEPEQIVCVTGDPQSGKTLLARAILGLWPTESGYISYDGALLNQRSATFMRRFTSYVPQSLPDDKVSAVTAIREVAALKKNVLIIDSPTLADGKELKEASLLIRQVAERGTAVLLICDSRHPLLPAISSQHPIFTYQLSTRNYPL